MRFRHSRACVSGLPGPSYGARPRGRTTQVRPKRGSVSTRLTLVAALAAAIAVGCNRNVEPFDPDETVRAPDLSKIFPEGAERSADSRLAADVVPAAPVPNAPPGRPGASDAPPIRGTLSLDPGLAALVPPEGVLFLIARGPTPGPPVAVKRIARPRFPLSFEIGPDDRMIAAIPFTGPLELVARIDADGNATTRGAGDLQGAALSAVEPGANGVTIVIDEVL